MFGIDSAAGLIVAVISVFEAIQQKTELIQCNKHRCKRLIRRVSLFHGYLERQRKSKLSKGEKDVLRSLKDVFEEINTFLSQFYSAGDYFFKLKRWYIKAKNAEKESEMFQQYNEELTEMLNLCGVHKLDTLCKSVESIARSVSQGTIPTVWWTEDEEDEGKDIEEGLDEIKKEKSVLMKNFGMEEAQVDQAIEQMQRLKGPSSGKSTAHDVSTETLRIIADEELKFAKGTIGVGGSAQVSKAVWKCKENGVLVERTVAVKRIVLGTATRRVSREIRIHQSLQHENIVKLYGQLKCNLGSTTGLVLEFMEGGSLYDYLRAVRDPAQEEESPTELQGWKIFLDILQGLQFLHGRQVVHADMKSSNVLLTEDRRTAKLSDFGASIRMMSMSHASATDGGKQITFQYTPPELLSNDGRPSFASDVYSTGMVLYELLTGTPPYTGVGLFNVGKKIQKGELPPFPQAVDGEFEAACSMWKAMVQYEPEKRATLAWAVQQTKQHISGLGGLSEARDCPSESPAEVSVTPPSKEAPLEKASTKAPEEPATTTRGASVNRQSSSNGGSESKP